MHGCLGAGSVFYKEINGIASKILAHAQHAQHIQHTDKYCTLCIPLYVYKIHGERQAVIDPQHATVHGTD